MPKRDATYTTVEGTYLTSTRDAILVRIDEVKHWLPVSQVEGLPDALTSGDHVTVTIPEWLAEDRDIYGIEDTD